MTANGTTTQHGYDAFARRTTATTGAETTRSTYDGWNVAQVDDGDVLKTLLSGGGLDDLLAMTSDGQTQAVLSDAQGTTIASLNGTAIQPADLVDPFGNGTSTGNRWAGGRRDATGLIDRRLRDYDPSLSSFISEDPSGVNGGFNLYAYTAGDPLNRIDPMGLSFLGSVGSVAAGIGVGIANGATFGGFGALTGMHACGAAGQIGSWIGSGLLAWGTGGIATIGLSAVGASAGGALVAGGAIGGAIGSVSSSVANGQTPNGASIGAGAIAGAAPGVAHVVGAGPAAGTWFDIWRVTPLTPGAVAMADEFNTLYGPGSNGGRKC